MHPKSLPPALAEDERDHYFPQRGVVCAAAHCVERRESIAAGVAARDHSRGRREHGDRAQGAAGGLREGDSSDGQSNKDGETGGLDSRAFDRR